MPNIPTFAFSLGLIITAIHAKDNFTPSMGDSESWIAFFFPPTDFQFLIPACPSVSQHCSPDTQNGLFCPTTGQFLAIFFALIGVFGAQKTVRFAALKTLTDVFSIDP
jgi:hypothetical protein